MHWRTYFLIFLIMMPAGVVAGEARAGATDGWVEFKHLSGATLKHPQGWTVQNEPNGVMLIPPHSGNNEVIVASGLPSNAAKPSSPEVSAYLDAVMSQMLPGLRRSGQPQSLAAANGKGALYRYEGTLPDGTPVVCEVYTTIENGFALSLSAIATPAKIISRTPVLQQIFASMTMKSAPAKATEGAADDNTAASDDPRLVGMFAGESLAGGGGSGVYINTQLVYVLNADGTLYYGAQSHFDAVTRDISGNTKWSASGVTDGSVQSGRWRAQDGFLAITWNSGKQSYFAYGFEPDGSLVFRHPRTRKLINFYKRVQ